MSDSDAYDDQTEVRDRDDDDRTDDYDARGVDTNQESRASGYRPSSHCSVCGSSSSRSCLR